MATRTVASDSRRSMLSQTANRVLARAQASRFFRTPALPSPWQGIPGVRTISVPAGPIGLRLWPRDEDEDIGAVVKGFVGVPAAKGSPNHRRGKSDPSPVAVAGISIGTELIGINDVQVSEMPYEDIMDELRSTAHKPKELHFRSPDVIPRAGSFQHAAHVARSKSSRNESAAATFNPAPRHVKAGTVIVCKSVSGDLGISLKPAKPIRAVGAVVWEFKSVEVTYDGGVREFVKSPVEAQGVVAGMHLTKVDGHRIDDMLHERILRLLDTDEPKTLTFEALNGLHEASNAKAAAVESDSDDDLPVARSRKRRKYRGHIRKPTPKMSFDKDDDDDDFSLFGLD